MDGGSDLQNKCLYECEPPSARGHKFIITPPAPSYTKRGIKKNKPFDKLEVNKKSPLLATFRRHSFVLKTAFQHSLYKPSILHQIMQIFLWITTRLNFFYKILSFFFKRRVYFYYLLQNTDRFRSPIYLQVSGC